MLMTRLRHLQRDECGMSLAFVAVGLAAFLAASTLAIDVGMFMTARSQAQNSADAGALAGAVALAINDYNDRSASGPAVQAAINTAHENDVMRADVSVLTSDVTFPAGPGGQSNRVKVDVFRTAARGNPIATMMGRFLTIDEADVAATATAQASPANAMTCVKPFTIPDRWKENNDGPWNPDSSYDRYDNKGKILPNADVYYPPGHPNYAGYDSTTDKGLPLMIRAGTGNNISPSFYFSWAMPGGSGGSFYRDNIADCNTAVFGFGADMTAEPGNMVGPTNQGVDDLIAKDPDAYWDRTTNSVHSDMSPSPRVFPIPLFDPEYYADGKKNGRGASLKMANWIGFFLEKRQGNNVYGRITPIRGVLDAGAGPAPQGSFPYVIQLVK